MANLRDSLMNRYRDLIHREHPDVPDWPVASGCDIVQARYGNTLFVHLKDTMVGGISLTSGMLTLSKGVVGVDRVDRANRRAVLDRLETHFRPGPRDMLLLLEDVIQSDGRLAIPNNLLDEQLRDAMLRHELVLGIRPMKIFLSHKSADKAKVTTYYETLRLLGFDPWLDREDMPAGTNLHRGILKGFQDSCAAIFFVTPNFRDEAFLATEVDYAISQKTKKGNQFAIITLVFRDGDREGTVPALLREQYVFVHPKDDLDGLREVLRALPLRVGPVRWTI